MRRWSNRDERAFDAFLEGEATASDPLTSSVSRLQAIADADLQAVSPGDAALVSGWESIIGTVEGDRTPSSATNRGVSRSPETSRARREEAQVLPGPRHRIGRYGMSYMSRAMLGIAVAVLIAGSVPIVQEVFNDDDTQQLAFLATPVPQGADMPVTVLPGGGSDLPELTDPGWITEEECTGEPRTERELLDVLSITTSAEAGDPDIMSSEVFGGRGVSIDAESYARLTGVFRAYQACAIFGTTYERLAFESNDLIRSYVYQPYGVQRTAYSETTLREIIAGWIEVDQMEGRPGGHFHRNSPVQLSPEGMVVSDDGRTVMFEMVSGHWNRQDWVTNPYGRVTFVLEHGHWRVLTITFEGMG